MKFLNINHLLLLTFLVFLSCTGQVKTQSSKDIAVQEKTSPVGYPLIIRTQGLSSGNINCELQDREGNLWFSTSGEGVYRYDGKTFANFTTKDGLCDNEASDIIQCKSGKILIGTKSGICMYDGKGFSRYLETASINKLNICSLYEDNEGNIWFGTMTNGIYRYDGKNLSNFLNNDDFNLGNRYQLIMDILQDKKGNMWFSSFNGGGVWTYNGKTFTNYLPSKYYYQSNEDGRTLTNSKKVLFNDFSIKAKYISSQDSISDDMINSITEDKAGNLWFGTRRHGACRFDGKTFTIFRENEGLVSDAIYSIVEDKKGNMWFSTEKNGVYFYNGKSFKNFTTAHGLVNNSVHSILEDKAGNLWFGTRGFGLSRFDGKDFVTFSKLTEK